jgi:hypothetical protein
LLEAIDKYAVEHGHGSVELKMAFELLRSVQAIVEEILAKPGGI